MTIKEEVKRIEDSVREYHLSLLKQVLREQSVFFQNAAGDVQHLNVAVIDECGDIILSKNGGF